MTNEQIAEHLKQVGSHLAEMEGLLLSVAFAEAKLYEMIAVRMPGVTPDEKAALTSGAQRCQDDCSRLQLLRKKFSQDVEAFSRL